MYKKYISIINPDSDILLQLHKNKMRLHQHQVLSQGHLAYLRHQLYMIPDMSVQVHLWGKRHAHVSWPPGLNTEPSAQIGSEGKL